MVYSICDGRLNRVIMKKQTKQNRYEKVRKLGEGTFGSVHEVMDHRLNMRVAMKKIKFLQEDEGVPINALRQIVLLKHLSHPNIVRIYDVHYNWEEGRLFFTMELHRENLYQHCRAREKMPFFSIKAYMWQLLQALSYLESKGAMHRDIKPQNILVSEEGIIKLCDFGQSRLSTPRHPHLTSEISTLWYKAPQVLLGAPTYTNKVDVWALGCIFAEMHTKTALFKGDSEIGQVFAILSQRGISEAIKTWKHHSTSFPRFEAKPLCISGMSQAGHLLLDAMLQVDPSKRISISRALRHEYFEGM